MVSLALAVAGFTKARIMLDIIAQQEVIQSCALSKITPQDNANRVTVDPGITLEKITKQQMITGQS